MINLNYAYIGVETTPDFTEVVAQVRIHELVVALIRLLEGRDCNRDK